MRTAFLIPLLAAIGWLHAEETRVPVAHTPRQVALHFAPPPLEGTISLGIYNTDGKLVRVLHREDAIADFTVGHDALETTWDGNDDTGQPSPPGRYRAGGYLVGDLKVEGVDYFFNDWVTDENSPHLARITRIDARDKLLELAATTPDGKAARFLFDPATEKLTTTQEPSQPAAAPNNPRLLIDAVPCANGRGGTIWAISHLSKGSPEVEIVQLSSEPAILRKLSIEPGAPQPIGIAAAPTDDRIFLLEESSALERVRSLTLQATSAAKNPGETVSDWKIDFEKKIVAHQNFTLVNGMPAISPNDAQIPNVKITRRLRPNPLERDRPGKIDLAVGFDADGSYLQTSDGLPLRTVSETRQLKRALIAAHGDDAVDVFADDGAVVEQFRISRLGEMMAFDCGAFELK